METEKKYNVRWKAFPSIHLYVTAETNMDMEKETLLVKRKELNNCEKYWNKFGEDAQILHEKQVFIDKNTRKCYYTTINKIGGIHKHN